MSEILSPEQSEDSIPFTNPGEFLQSFHQSPEYQQMLSRRLEEATGSERYDRLFKQLGINCRVIPLWVEATVNPHQNEGQDPTTGQVVLPDEFENSRFARQVYQAIGGRNES
jgi:uncharacterized protein (DUF1330 family)